jgi:hypothetical protein
MFFNSQAFLEEISSHECLLNSNFDKDILKSELSFSFQDSIENNPVKVNFLPYTKDDGLIGGRFKFTLTIVDTIPKMSVESSLVNALVDKHNLNWHVLHLNEAPSSTKSLIECCIGVGAELKQNLLDGQTPTEFFEKTILPYFMMWVYIDIYGFNPNWYKERGHCNRGLYESFAEYGDQWTDEVFTKDFVDRLKPNFSLYTNLETLDLTRYAREFRYRKTCDKALRHNSDGEYVDILKRVVIRCKKLKLV